MHVCVFYENMESSVVCVCLGKSMFVNWSGSTDINWEEILLAQLFILFGSWSQGYILQWTWDLL